MKKTMIMLSVFAVAILLFSGFKGGDGFTVEVSNSYAVATKADEVDTVAERLNLSEDEVASYFTQNALCFIAVSGDGKTQVRISRFADNFSSDVYDAENLTNEQTSQMISLYSTSYDTATVIESGGRRFAKTVETLEDSGGVYTATQYITVSGGKVYAITCYNPGDAESSEIEGIFSTFKVDDMTASINSYQTRRKWMIPLIVITCGAVGLSVFGICKRLFEK